jgi:hypothetical protein
MHGLRRIFVLAMSDKTPVNRLKQKEMLRLTILLEAYERQPNELTLEYLIPKLRTFRGQPATDGEIEAAIQFLIDKSWIEMRFSEFGSTKYFRITATGVLLMERQHAHLLDSNNRT